MDLLEALHKVAVGNGSGFVPDHILVKACESYKLNSTEFIESVENDAMISKSVLPGTTKVVDGVVYIYTATPNAQTSFDWRVYKPSSGAALNTAKQTSKKAYNSQQYVNDLFPLELASFVDVKSLSGSTGAKLVKDSGGSEYVMKKGANTSSAHVESEYIANQLYEILGVRTPDYQLYDDKGEKVLVSKFIHNSKPISASDYDELSKNFAIDVLLANWDVYQNNDNCLKDASGRIFRVDNGGCLSFSAQGRTKPFNSKVDWQGMVKHNGHVIANLTEQDMIDQIDALMSKKDLVVDYLNVSGQSTLAKTFSDRFDDLENIKKYYEGVNLKKQGKAALKNRPRVLLPDADMYKEFDDLELDSIWKSVNGTWRDKIFNTGRNGWELVENICKLRGFDARPEVLSTKDYWDEVSKNPGNQLFRGVDGRGNNSGEDFVDDFRYQDTCFYGNIGIYGSGIYFHVNDNQSGSQHDSATYKQSKAYHHAQSYGSAIIDAAISTKAKIADYHKLKIELEALVTYDDEAAKQIQAKIKSLESEINTKVSQLNNLTQVTEDSIKKDMGWDDNSYVMHAIEIDNIDWSSTDDEGKPNYPSFDDFFLGDVKNWVEANKGTVTEKGAGSGEYILKMPNSKQTFLFSKYTYENNAIKQKNAFTKAYNYPVERFRDWFVTNHFAIINKKVEEAVADLGTQVVQIKSEISDKKHELHTEENNLSNVKSKNVNPDKDVLSACIHSVRNGNSEALGVFAALKGYDAIKVPNGNSMGNSFLVVLNRSKIIVKE